MIRGYVAWLGVLLVPAVCLAQQPTGTIAGVVRDPANAAVRDVRVTATSRATRQVRTTATGSDGEYSIPALVPGEYDVVTETTGFQRVTSLALVEAGATTRADLVLQLATVSEVVTVGASLPQLRYDSAAVSGLITRDQIRGLPLNGRNPLELAKLEPGVLSPSVANRNRLVVPVLAAPAQNVGGPRYTADGGSITAVAFGGAQMALSQEQIEQFQVATVNVDLAASMTDSGTINIVTRSGTNGHQGTGFYFLRDHQLAAYPALQRDPNHPDPFFRRQQFGGAAGGPLRRDRAFYFVNWERNDQDAAASTTILAPDFAHLTRLTSSPFRGDLFSARVDGRLAAHTVFARYSQDSSDAFGSATASSGESPNAYPSNWSRGASDAAQAVAGATSVLRRTLVSDLRVSVFGVRSALGPGRAADCERCLGLGSPAINVAQAGLVLGNSTAVDYQARRLHVSGGLTWQTGGHQVRTGIDWEHNDERNLIWNNEPVSLTLWSPDQVRAYNARVSTEQHLPLPAAFTTIDDVLRLPLQSMNISVGEPGVPQEGGGEWRRWNTVWIYAQDAWRVHERLTITYGLGWAFDGNLNHDLGKPDLLAPLLGADALGPTRRNWTNFAPAAGLVWAMTDSGDTLFRAGAGRYYRMHGLTSSMDAERVALGPPGQRQAFAGSSIPNPLAGIPGVLPGRSLDFRTDPTRFTGADVLAILPSTRTDLLRTLAEANRDVAQIQITKQASAAIFPERVASPSAVHLNAGAQRRVGPNTVVSVDLVYRRFADVPQSGGAIDLNHFNRAGAGRVLPLCNAIEARDPQAMCSRGSILVYQAPFHFDYKGVLLRAERRVSAGLQLLGSYAYSRSAGTNPGTGFDNDNWLANTGPPATDLRHLANLAGVLTLPHGLELGFNFSYASAPPFSAFVRQIDFNGDGTTGDLLPGTTVNAFNRGMNRDDLERLVGEFNGRFAGTTDAQGARIPALALPADYAFGDNFQTLDLRLTRWFTLGSRARLALIAEVFNAYDAENLTGHSGDLTSTGFGQPTSRGTQVFGSGGPRSFQVAARITF